MTDTSGTGAFPHDPDGPGPVVIRNPAEAAGAPPAPRRADGRLWRYEMIYSGGTSRAYGQTPVALMDALIPGYSDLSAPTATARARIRLACDLQVRIQAAITAAVDLNDCTPAERDILIGDFSRPPVIERWTAAVPLVLVRSFYLPIGAIPVPQGETILWLDPVDDWSLLVSLAEAGAIHLSQASGADHHPGDAAPPGETDHGRR